MCSTLASSICELHSPRSRCIWTTWRRLAALISCRVARAAGGVLGVFEAHAMGAVQSLLDWPFGHFVNVSVQSEFHKVGVGLSFWICKGGFMVGNLPGAGEIFSALSITSTQSLHGPAQGAVILQPLLVWKNPDVWAFPFAGRTTRHKAAGFLREVPGSPPWHLPGEVDEAVTFTSAGTAVSGAGLFLDEDRLVWERVRALDGIRSGPAGGASGGRPAGPGPAAKRAGQR